MAAVKTIKNNELFADVEQIIAEGGQVELRVKGQSMHPFLRDGIDTVILSPVSSSQLRRGMVVLFRYNNHHILHRIRRIHGDILIIKGDGNYRSSEKASRADVVAHASAITHDGATIPYSSHAWKRLTRRSLCAKLLRTLKMDISRFIKSVCNYSN